VLESFTLTAGLAAVTDETRLYGGLPGQADSNA
jgi:hypothetical protein